MDELPPEEYQRQMQEGRAKLELIQGGGKPERMTLSKIVEQLLARGTQDRSSVTLARNAKGETQIEVTVRTEAAAGVPTVDEAAAKALEVYDMLRGRYPMQSGFTGATPAWPELPDPSKAV